MQALIQQQHSTDHKSLLQYMSKEHSAQESTMLQSALLGKSIHMAERDMI